MKYNLAEKKRRSMLTALTTVGMAGAIIVPVVAAWAEPAGCSSRVSGYTTSNGKLVADGYGDCNGRATRTLRTEIKQSLGSRPDPLVAANEDRHYGRSYHSHVETCDNGKTAYYYGRAFFTINSTYHDTETTRQTTCN